MVTGFLKDVSMNTFVAQLPSIIGFNNRAIESEFKFIFDPSINAIPHSVDDPDGYVNVHWGKFKNIETDYIKVNDTSSLSKLLNNTPHNNFSGRFVSLNIDEQSKAKYCHDASSIYINNNMNLYELLVSMQQRISYLESKIK